MYKWKKDKGKNRNPNHEFKKEGCHVIKSREFHIFVCAQKATFE